MLKYGNLTYSLSHYFQFQLIEFKNQIWVKVPLKSEMKYIGNFKSTSKGIIIQYILYDAVRVPLSDKTQANMQFMPTKIYMTHG